MRFLLKIYCKNNHIRTIIKKESTIFDLKRELIIFTHTKARHMKKFLHLAVLMFISVGAYAQSGPKIEFKSDTVDYGTTNKTDDNGIRVFEFTNTGNADLVITDVKSTCGCTVPSKPIAPIKPGKTGSIQVKYDMHPGPFRKTITVQSNAINVPDGVVALKLKGEIVEKDKTEVLQKKKTMMDLKQ